MRQNQIVVDHGADIGLVDHLERVDLVRGAEAVEEVHERHARLKRRRLGDERHVMGLLHRVRGQHGKARGAGGHDVGMVAEDRQRVGRKGARRHVEDGRRQFAGNLEHVGDHQHQALRGREGGGEGAGLQRAVYGAGGAAFALHLLDREDVAPDVLDAGRGPFVGQFRHHRRGGDRDRSRRLRSPCRRCGQQRCCRPWWPFWPVCQPLEAVSGIMSMAWHGHCS